MLLRCLQRARLPKKRIKPAQLLLHPHPLHLRTQERPAGQQQDQQDRQQEVVEEEEV